jgi:hypothetical protein
MTTDILSDLDVFYGDLTVSRAYVYARLPRPAEDAGLSLVGQVRGPRCKLAETLPLTSPLVDLGPGPTLLARALVPDPVFWSPDLPAIYDVTVNLLQGTEIIATARRQIGLRSLGVRGKSLFLNGKRWVLRGVSPYSTSARTPQEWHNVQATYHNDDDDSKLIDLGEASECGTLAVIHVPEFVRSVVPRIRRLAEFPAVAIVVIEDPLPPNFHKLQVAPNLILAQWITPDCHWPPQSWAELLVVCADEQDLIAETLALGEFPIIAERREVFGPELDLATARAACDALQRDLAPLGQFAGYVV